LLFLEKVKKFYIEQKVDENLTIETAAQMQIKFNSIMVNKS